MRQFELFASATLPTSWEMAAILLGVPLIFLILSLALNTACVVGNAVFRLGGTSVDVRRIIIKGCGIVFCGAFFGAVAMAVLSWPLSVLHPRIEQLISKGVLIGMIAYFLRDEIQVSYFRATLISLICFCLLYLTGWVLGVL